MIRGSVGFGTLGVVLVVGATVAAGQAPPASQPITASQPATTSQPLAASQPTTSPADEAAVYVDGEPILERDIQEYLEKTTPADVWAGRQGRYSMVFQQYRARLVMRRIYELLLDREMAQIGLRVDEAAVRRWMEEELDAFLSVNGLTREQFGEQLRAERGKSLDEFLAERVANKARQRDVLEWTLFERKYPDVRNVSDEDIKGYYDRKRDERFVKEAEVRASHILISTEGKSDEEKVALRQKAEEALAAAQQPAADFAALARERSDCPSKLREGDLGFFTRQGSQPEPLAELAFRLKVGEVGGVVETWSGYHVVKVTDRHEGKNISLEQARLGVRYALVDQQIREKRRAYLTELKERAKIVYPPGKEPPEMHDLGADAGPPPPSLSPASRPED